MCVCARISPNMPISPIRSCATRMHRPLAYGRTEPHSASTFDRTLPMPPPPPPTPPLPAHRAFVSRWTTRHLAVCTRAPSAFRHIKSFPAAAIAFMHLSLGAHTPKASCVSSFLHRSRTRAYAHAPRVARAAAASAAASASRARVCSLVARQQTGHNPLGTAARHRPFIG